MCTPFPPGTLKYHPSFTYRTLDMSHVQNIISKDSGMTPQLPVILIKEGDAYFNALQRYLRDVTLYKSTHT